MTIKGGKRRQQWTDWEETLRSKHKGGWIAMLNANRRPVQPNRRTFPSDVAGCVNEQLPGFGCIRAKEALQPLPANHRMLRAPRFLAISGTSRASVSFSAACFNLWNDSLVSSALKAPILVASAQAATDPTQMNVSPTPPRMRFREMSNQTQLLASTRAK